MQTLMLALGDAVTCVGQGVAFQLIGTEPPRIQLDIGREGRTRHPFLLSQQGRRWYQQGDWLVLAPGIQVCAVGVQNDQARFYVITHSPLRIQRTAFRDFRQENAA